jgi:outer membrane protein assembly factor BamD
MNRINFIITLFLTLFLVACATTEPLDPADMYKDKSEMQAFKDGEKAMLKKNYQEAVLHFKAIHARYPFGKYARQSQLDIIYTYYQQDDTASALAAASQYIHLYPKGKDVDYAYYIRGLIEFNENHSFFEKYFKVDFAKRDITTLKEAYLDFNQVVRFYPNSPYWADARQRMVYIRNVFARQQLLTAKFYLENNSYVAAANRANEIVQNYQQSTSVSEALAVMAKAYINLHLDKEASDALEILKLNFGCETVKKFMGETAVCS